MYFLKMSKSSVSCFGKLFLLLRSDLKVSWLHQIYSSLHRNEFPQMFVGQKTNKQTSSVFFHPVVAELDWKWSHCPLSHCRQKVIIFLISDHSHLGFGNKIAKPFSCQSCLSWHILGVFLHKWDFLLFFGEHPASPLLTIHSLHFAVATIALLCFVVTVVVVVVVHWTVL